MSGEVGTRTSGLLPLLRTPIPSLAAGYVRTGYEFYACYGYRLLLAFSAAPRAHELDLARASVDLSLLNLPQLLLAHGLHLVRLRYLSRPER